MHEVRKFMKKLENSRKNLEIHTKMWKFMKKIRKIR